MPGVTKEQIAEAKGVDALSYVLEHEPNNIKRSGGNEYRLIDHDSLKFSNGKFHWFSRGIGGRTALDFLIKVRGVDFVEAVKLLTYDARAGPISLQPVNLPPKIVPEKKPKPFALPKPNINNDRAIAYLMGRGIDKEIIARCIEAGTLYESRKYHNCTFVGTDAGGAARFACVRSTTNTVRLDIEGSDKRYSFSIQAQKPPGDTVMVAEAPVDVLSLATIRKMETKDWDGCHYLSLGGTSPLALLRYLADYREIDNVVLCLDNDKAGLEAIARIQTAVFSDESLAGRMLMVKSLPPKIGKDYNDALLAIISERKKHMKSSRPNDRAAVSI